MTAAGRRSGEQSGSRRAREPRGRREQAAPTARTWAAWTGSSPSPASRPPAARDPSG